MPLDAAFRIDIADYRRPSGAVILPNPNAPTGIGLPLAEIERLVAEHPGQPVVIDEAYIDFGGESAIALVPKYDNLLVVQTFSKSRALAGLRVGFAIGQRPLIEALERVKDSFNSIRSDAPPGGCNGRDRGRGVVRGDPRQDHRLAGEADERTRKARLRGPAVTGKLRLRPPPRTCGPDAGGETARKGCDRPPFRQAANRGFPAHHHRHRRGMRQAGRGARRGSVRVERRTARFAPLLGFNPRTNPLPAGRLWHMHICSSGGSRCHGYAINGLTFACLNDATDRTQKWRRSSPHIFSPLVGETTSGLTFTYPKRCRRQTASLEARARRFLPMATDSARGSGAYMP